MGLETVYPQSYKEVLGLKHQIILKPFVLRGIPH